MFAKHIFMMYSLGSWDTDLPLCMRISTWIIHHCGFSPVARSSVYPKIHTSHLHHSWGVVLRRIWSYKHTPLHENMYGGCSMCWYWYFIILWELDEYSNIHSLYWIVLSIGLRYRDPPWYTYIYTFPSNYEIIRRHTRTNIAVSLA